MDFLELAKQRYSERFFDSCPVEQEKLDRILEAGRIVPTACNYQPQHFYVIRGQEALAKAKTVTPFHYNAPLMLLVCYDANTVWRNPSDRYYGNTVIRAIRSTLEEAGVGDLFFMKHGSMRILLEKISCDVYRLFRGDPEAVNSYRGEYMSVYSWASITEGCLAWKFFDGEL